MRIVCISDTHLRTPELPEGDVLVHAGDATFNGQRDQIKSFAKYMKRQPHKHKLFVPGNHDIMFQDNLGVAKSFLNGCRTRTLIDENITIDGVKFYGSPWQPEFFSWAFNLPRGPALRAVWAEIPDDTQVLITHGPPMSILDLTVQGEHVGCADLLLRTGQLKSLRLHVFGHIHHAYGSAHVNGVNYFNASICDEQYQPTHPPLVYDL